MRGTKKYSQKRKKKQMKNRQRGDFLIELKNRGRVSDNLVKSRKLIELILNYGIY